jgi:hypothetical protein
MAETVVIRKMTKWPILYRIGHALGRPQLGMKWALADDMLLGPEAVPRPIDSGVSEPATEYGLDAVKYN